MYELKLNNYPVGTFKTLREARAYEPSWIDAIAAGIDPMNGSYVRIIKKITQFNRSKDLQKSGLQNEII